MKTLFAFYKGSAGEYQKLNNLAFMVLPAAAAMRTAYKKIPQKPIKLSVKHEYEQGSNS